MIQDLIPHFTSFNIASVPRLQNVRVDILDNVASNRIPCEDFSHDRISIELILCPSIRDTITNYYVFNDDNDNLGLLTSKRSYSHQITDEDEHDRQLNKSCEENYLPNPVVKLEYLYDLKDRLKKVTNCKLQSSALIFELVNLGYDHKPKNINLGLGHTPDERSYFMHLLKIYKDVFSWRLDDLKTCDTSII